MSTPNSKPNRQALLDAVGTHLGRELSGRTILFHQAVAERLGVRVTDLKCLDYAARGEPVTAGRLAEITGLTTGAITGVIDRLEKAGLVKRQRTPEDRRKVFIVPGNGKMLPKVGRYFEPLAEAMMKLSSGYTNEELQFVHEHMQRCIEILKEQTEKLRNQPEAGCAKPPRSPDAEQSAKSAFCSAAPG